MLIATTLSIGKGALKHMRNLLGQGPEAPCTILRTLGIESMRRCMFLYLLDIIPP